MVNPPPPGDRRTAVLALSWLALAGCGAGVLPATTIHGIQVVAIETTPPQPSDADPLTIRAWVADGLGHGTDVLVWSCVPVDGVCLEANLGDLLGVTSDGVPLPLWTRTGRASPSFTAQVPWPFLAGLVTDDEAPVPDTGYGARPPGREREPEALLVWALACAPGVCPIIDAVMAEPAPGSEAWHAVVADLSDPSRWIGEVPAGEASVAVKSVPLWSEPEVQGYFGYYPYGYGGEESDRNREPVLELVEQSGEPGRPRVSRFLYWDPDPGDRPSARAFTTRGVVDVTTTDDGDLLLSWEEPLFSEQPREAFVVLDDGRGGTAVWASSDRDRDPCTEEPRVVPQHAPGVRFDPGDDLPIELYGSYWGYYGYSAWVDVSARLEGFSSRPQVVRAKVEVVDGPVIGEMTLDVPWDADTCSAALPPFQIFLDPSWGALFGMDAYCAMAGKLVEVSMTAYTVDYGSYTDSGYGYGYGYGEPVEVTGTVPAVLTLRPGMPCTQ